MSIADLYHIRRAIQRDEQWRPQAELSTQAADGRSFCIFCHQAPSQYACPTCQAPYCSLKCFRSPRHSVCATSFAKSSIRSAIDESTAASSSKLVVDETEGLPGPESGRKSMLDILSRTAGLDLDETFAPNIAHSGSDAEDDDEGLSELISPKQPSAKYLEALEPLLRQASQRLVSTEPGSDPAPSCRLCYNVAAVVAAHAFVTNDLDVETLASLSSNPEDANGDSEQQQPRKLLVPVIKSILSDLVPFLTATSPRTSSKGKAKAPTKRTVDRAAGQDLALVLQDAEDVALYLLSRLQPLIEHTEIDQNSLLRQMLTRTIEIMSESKVVAVTSSSPSAPQGTTSPSELHSTLATRIQSRAQILHVLSDLSSIFTKSIDQADPPSSSKRSGQDLDPVQRKLLFYGMAMLMLPSGEGEGDESKASLQGCGLADVVSGLRREVTKLEKEADDRAGLDGLHVWEQQQKGGHSAVGLVASRIQAVRKPGTALISVEEKRP